MLSLPIWAKSKKRYTGLVDVTDVVTFIHQHFSRDILAVDNVNEFLSAKDRFTSMHVSSIANLSERNPWYPVDKSAPLLRLLETVSRHNIHRIPVVEHDGELYSIVSQTDLVAFVCANLSTPAFAHFAQASIHDNAHPIGTWGRVVTVHGSEPALMAFQKIHDLRVTGVAVVDEKSGKLLANISASDLRLIGNEGSSLSVLYNSCIDYVQLSQNSSHVKALVCVKREATFVEVVQLMDRTRAHRVYVVDEEQRPVGVVSQVDILKAIVHRIEQEKNKH